MCKVWILEFGDFGFWILGILDFGFWGSWILDFGFWGSWILDFGLGILDGHLVTKFWMLHKKRRLCTPNRVGGFLSLFSEKIFLIFGPSFVPVTFFYSASRSAFNDIQIGDNRCSRSTCCPVGFAAARGWDAVSGCGSPDFQLVAKTLREERGGAGMTWSCGQGRFL